jgi:RNA-binding protein YhbY
MYDATGNLDAQLPTQLLKLWQSIKKPLLTLNIQRQTTDSTLTSIKTLLAAHEVIKVKFTAVNEKAGGEGDSETSVGDRRLQIVSKMNALIKLCGIDAEVLHCRISERTVMVAMAGVADAVMAGKVRGKGMEKEAWEKKYRGTPKPEKVMVEGESSKTSGAPAWKVARGAKRVDKSD